MFLMRCRSQSIAEPTFLAHSRLAVRQHNASAGNHSHREIHHCPGHCAPAGLSQPVAGDTRVATSGPIPLRIAPLHPLPARAAAALENTNRNITRAPFIFVSRMSSSLENQPIFPYRPLFGGDMNPQCHLLAISRERAH